MKGMWSLCLRYLGFTSPGCAYRLYNVTQVEPYLRAQ